MQTDDNGIRRNPNYAAELRAWMLDCETLKETNDVQTKNQTPAAGRLDDHGVSLLLGWTVDDD